MNYVLFQPISETHGYAVEKVGCQYQIIYVSYAKDAAGKIDMIKEAASSSAGRLHLYSNPFLAGHVIRKEILPLYGKTVV